MRGLETSRCVGPGTGWTPRYITLWSGETLIGATFLFLKTHSYGEYIFDWQWAQAYKHHGVAYYPKLLSAVPFTPATGPKILIGLNRSDEMAIRAMLLNASLEFAQAAHCSSFHSLFIPKSEIETYRQMGMLIRHTFQYHWHNRGYADFEAFLQSLKSDKRRKIAKERREVQAQGFTFEVLSGADIRESHAELMYEFYLSTITKMQGIPYLNAAFFRTAFAAMPEKIVLCLAKKEGAYVAGALNFAQNRNLYGRYWGCSESYQFLHFELCYYQTVEYAIKTGMELFEAGAQGDHKLQRGFLPAYTYSAHWLQDERFHNAIAQFVEGEQEALTAEIEASRSHFPYRVESSES